MTRGYLKLTVATVGFCVTLGVQAASAQNFFSSLFGGGQPPEGRSAYERDTGARSGLFGWGGGAPADGTLDPADPRLHREIVKRRAVARPHVEGGGSTGKQKAIEPTAEAPAGSLALFEKDKTLRAGDVVVTNRGFLVYQGGGQRDGSAFVAINGARSEKYGRGSLIALEQASRMKTPNVTFENVKVQRDFIGPRLPEQIAARTTAEN